MKRCLFPGCVNTPPITATGRQKNICDPCLESLNDFSSPSMSFVEFYRRCELLVMDFAKAGGNLASVGAKW